MYRISSLSSKLSTRVSPSESAAKRRQRLLRDLEPGSVTVPSKLLIGVTVKVSAEEAVEAISKIDERCCWVLKADGLNAVAAPHNERLAKEKRRFMVVTRLIFCVSLDQTKRCKCPLILNLESARNCCDVFGIAF
mmetsp:Transcript_3293/g.7243  ORF Transcript_3293/g.7243 Transcript_3293/m.7243 type:complete len:135 (-) Transcript_3293:27-431(-)